MVKAALPAGLCLALLTGGCALNAKVGLMAGASAMVAANDRNGDGYLDRDEVRAMIERALPPRRFKGGFWERLRASLIAAYWSRDRNGDGRLSADELTQGIGR